MYLYIYVFNIYRSVAVISMLCRLTLLFMLNVYSWKFGRGYRCDNNLFLSFFIAYSSYSAWTELYGEIDTIFLDLWVLFSYDTLSKIRLNVFKVW